MDQHSYDLARWMLENPDKSALGAVIVAGSWRVLREIWKDIRGKRDETLVEALMRENHELRAALDECRRKGGENGRE